MTTGEKAERLHRKVNTFFLSCVGPDGYPLTKAVVPGKYRESLREIYLYKNAYPQKFFTDPDFCVLRFTPTFGRFYADFAIADFEIQGLSR